jgi:hypothetical protein
MSFWLLLLIALIAVIVFYILANGNKTFTSSAEVEVNAPLEFAFKTAMDEEFTKEWLSSPQMVFEDIENISGDKYEVGSKWKLTFSQGGKRKMEMIETVTDFVENEHFGIELEDKMFLFHTDMRFKASGENTIITETQSGKGKNIISNTMMSLYSGQSQKLKQKIYEKLKEVIEREYQGSLQS